MKWGIELLLGILCLVVFLFIGKQLLKEPFADIPTPEIYDIQLFFKDYPFSQICDLWLASQPKIYQSFQIDEKGFSLPKDIIEQKVNTFLKKEIPTGPLTCPFISPESNDLDIVSSYVMNLKDNLFEQAHRTLLFCAIQAQKEIVNSKNSLKMKKSIEAFITECTPEELQLKSIVPLQCIDPAVMKASEKEILVQDSDQQRKQKLKKEIAIKLSKLQNSYDQYLTTTKNFWTENLSNLNKSLAIINAGLNNVENGSEKYQQLSEQKIKISDQIQTATFTLSFLTMTPEKIIEKTKENLAETKQIQNDIQSGKISFT